MNKFPEMTWEYEIYRIGTVIRITGLSRSSIYRLEALNQFPKRVKLGASAVGWRSKDIHAWVAGRKPAGSRWEK
jgi:prophage regulatory protein